MKASNSGAKARPCDDILGSDAHTIPASRLSQRRSFRLVTCLGRLHGRSGQGSALRAVRLRVRAGEMPARSRSMHSTRWVMRAVQGGEINHHALIVWPNIRSKRLHYSLWPRSCNACKEASWKLGIGAVGAGHAHPRRRTDPVEAHCAAQEADRKAAENADM